MKTIDELIADLAHDRFGVRFDAVLGLARHRNAAVPALCQALRNDHRYIRFTAAQALMKVGDEGAIESLKQMAQEADEMLADTARSAIWMIKRRINWQIPDAS